MTQTMLFLRTLLLAVLIYEPVWAADQPSAAEKTARHGEEFIRALNAQTPQARLELLERAYSPTAVAKVGMPKIIEQAERLRRQMAPLTFHSAQLSSMLRDGKPAYSLHVFASAQGQANSWRDFQFYVDAEKTWRLTQLVFIAEVTEPVVMPNGDIEDASTIEWLNRHLDGLVENHQLSGQMLVAVGDQLLINRAFGYADASRSRKVDHNTEFNLASGSKMFTAMLVMQSVAAGKLDLDAPITQFFEKSPELQSRLANISLRQLLSHTAGLGDFWTAEFAEARTQVRTTADLVPWVLKAEVDFAPGSAQQYSNSNFAIAGLVLEHLHTKPYHQLVQQYILRPLNLRHTTCQRFDLRKNKAEPLLRKGAEWRAAPGALQATAAGGCHSNATDMLKFMRAFNNGRLLAANEARAMLQAQFPPTSGDDESFGLGFQLYRHGGVRAFGHGGTAQGANFDARHYPDRDLTVVILSNQDNGAFDTLKRTVHKLVTSER